jgi:uncharacterized SAM-binding protein YcdF (DUF218 family)
MIVPDTNLRSVKTPAGLPRPAKATRAIAWGVVSALVVAAGGWVLWVTAQIRYYAEHDEARPADAIAVFGAAEYDGRPSPVLRARLDHALSLYREKLAPMMITLGGGDVTDQHSEGGVGHDYLLAHGVPESAIIAETESNNTQESAERLAVIARTNGLKRVLAVSDGTHLFRIHALCESQGITVFTSPRPPGKSIPRSEALKRWAHEVLSYTLWRARQGLGIRN